MIQVGGPYTPETLNEGKVNLGNPNNPVNATYSGGGSGTVSDFIWTRSSSTIYPTTLTDRVRLGANTFVGAERLRVLGETNTDTLRTANAYIDTARIRSGSNYANITASLTTTRNLLLPDASGTIALTSDIPLFANAALLATYTNTNAAITNAISYSHQHSNYSTLNGITPTLISNWNNAYSWGNHALAGYITAETDPIFVASAAYNITGINITDWNTAYGWGNHASAGYLTEEIDPIFIASAAYDIDSTDISNWDTAYTDSHTHSNKALLDTLTNAGAGIQFLTDDGTYKSITTTVAGNDTEIQFNDGGSSFGGDSTYTFNKTTKLVTSYDSLISNSLYLGDNTAYITNSSGDLSFTDINAGTVTLSTLLTGVTNYWSTTTGGIYYGAGTDKVGINTSSLTEALTIDGNIAATNFNSSYLRYKNSNLLLGPNAGDNETGDNLLYISNSDTANPLVKGDFLNQSIEFNADTYINSVKRLCFGSSEVYIRRDSTTDDMLFSDPNTNSGDPVKLSDFVRDASLYALKSDFTQYSAVTSITNANKTTWNKASVLITTGGGTNYLADDGTYKAAGGGVVPTDYTFKWDSGASYYRPYTTKTEAGGVLSAGKFYSGTDTPTATNRLNYDGDFYAHYFYGYRGEFTMVVGTTLNITSTTSVGGVMNSRGYTMSSNFGGNTTFSDNLLTVSRLVSDTVSSTGNILQLTDNPTSSGTISGALISGTVGTTERLRFDPRATSTGSTVSNFIDTHSVLNTGDKILSVRNHGNEIINVNPAGLKITGKLDVSGLIDPTGLQLDAVASNPGTSTTVWVNSGDNGLYYNTDKLGKAQSTGNTYNPANPFLFDNDYQYNNYTLSANITPTYSLTGAIALNGVSITFIGDGTHTVNFSNFTESDLSGAFDITNGAENKVIFYYDGIDVIYSVVSSAKIASSTVTGLLSSTDWTTFNSKQAGHTNLTSLSALTYASTSFVKMTAAGTFALDSNTYLTSASLSGYVPYTGATGNVTLGANTLSTTSGLITPKIYPSADSTKAIQFNKADGTTNVLNVDTTNGRLGIGTTTPTSEFQVSSSRTTGFAPFFQIAAGKATGNAASVAFTRTDNTQQTLFAFETTSSANPDGYFGTMPNKEDALYMLTGNGAGTLAAIGLDASLGLRIGTASNIVSGSVGASITPAGQAYFAGKVGIGTTSPTAILHLKAGTATANTAPLKFTAGTNLTTPEAGAVEFDGTHFYGTIGSTRYQLDQQSTPAIADNILEWDGTNNWYAPYSSKQASMSFYTGTTAPTLTDRLNLDGKLYSSGFSVTTGSTNTIGFQCVTNTGSAYGVYVNNNVGDGIYVLNSSSSSGIKIDNGSNVGLLVNNNSNGEGIKIQYSGSNRVSNFLNLTKSQSGTQDADGHFIKITDNSTTSGTISGKVLTASISGAERISLNPRVTNSGTNKAYILDTHNTLSGTTELLSIQNNTVERFRVTPTNTALPAGTSTTFATVGGVLKDFYTDVSTSGTSETDLYSYTIPANTLTTIGDKLIFKVYLNKTGIGSGSYVNFYLGGSALASSTYAVLSTGYGVECEILIIYTSASSAKIRYSYKGYTYTECYNNTSLAVNWTTTNVLKFVGRADTGSISVTEGYIEYKPAAIN